MHSAFLLLTAFLYASQQSAWNAMRGAPPSLSVCLSLSFIKLLPPSSESKALSRMQQLNFYNRWYI